MLSTLINITRKIKHISNTFSYKTTTSIIFDTNDWVYAWAVKLVLEPNVIIASHNKFFFMFIHSANRDPELHLYQIH